jgi:hypothetical protein
MAACLSDAHAYDKKIEKPYHIKQSLIRKQRNLIICGSSSLACEPDLIGNFLAFVTKQGL